MLLYSTRVLRQLEGAVFCREKGVASHSHCAQPSSRPADAHLRNRHTRSDATGW